MELITPRLISASFRSALALRATFFLRALLMFANNFIFFVTWIVLFQRVDNISGWRLHDVALVFGISAGSYGIACAILNGFLNLPELISTGALDSYLLMPFGLIRLILTSRAEPSAWGDVFSGFVFLHVSGYMSFAMLPTIALCVLCGAAVFVASGLIFHSLAFWLQDVDDLASKLWECTITFSLYPEAIFPLGVRLLLYTIWPAGLIVFFPCRILREHAPCLFLVLVPATVLFCLAAFFVFRLGLLRYESGNRWSVHGV